MNEARRVLLFAAIAICPRPHLAACDPPTGPVILHEVAEQEEASRSNAQRQAGTPRSASDEESPKYKQGYDPLKTHRNQVRLLPDEAWGKVVNGLQAAISAPDRIRLNEVVTVYLVLRNVSEKTIRVSLPQHPDILSFRRDGTTISYSVKMDNGPMSFRELKPGHQTLISSPPIQVLAPNGLGLNRALTRLRLGPHTIYARIGSGGHRWVPTGDGTSRRFFPLKGEWTGWLSPARRLVEVLAEKLPFEITPLGDLPDRHGLRHVVGSPPSLSKGQTEWTQLRDGLELALDGSQDAHWLLDYRTYNRTVSWGPIPAARLKDLKLLDRIRQLSHEYIQTAAHHSQVEGPGRLEGCHSTTRRNS